MAAPDLAAEDATVEDVGVTLPGFRRASSLYDVHTRARTLDVWTPVDEPREAGRDE